MPQSKHSLIGIGDSHFTFAIYIEGRPALVPFQTLSSLVALQTGDIKRIAEHCGNGWRKVFNVYAKLVFALSDTHLNLTPTLTTWQSFRDQSLCQQGSQTALLFSPPSILHPPQKTTPVIHIIAGRTYAKKLLQQRQLNAEFIWLDHEFAVDVSKNLIISPYLDYRQLSNVKIERLNQIITSLIQGGLP